jgi:hypothetical protein
MGLFSKRGPYEGPVCFVDGWHYSVKNGAPDKKLFLEDNGSYRYAVKGDPSWNARKHERFVQVVPS